MNKKDMKHLVASAVACALGSMAGMMLRNCSEITYAICVSFRPIAPFKNQLLMKFAGKKLDGTEKKKSCL